MAAGSHIGFDMGNLKPMSDDSLSAVWPIFSRAILSADKLLVSNLLEFLSADFLQCGPVIGFRYKYMFSSTNFS